MPTITINIAAPGTSLADCSIAVGGHMWFELDDGQGQLASMESFGWAPQGRSQRGQVTGEDSDSYQAKSYSKNIMISARQYQRMLAFARDPLSFGFASHYNVISSSGIDFTWRALQEGGLQPVHAGTTLWPVAGTPHNHHQIPPWPDADNIIEELFHASKKLLNATCKATLLDNLYKDASDGWVACWSRYEQQRSAIPRNDPLVLDLDDDGVETRGIFRGVYFDHDNDGINTITGWVAPDDGLLVLDRNGNGKIDSGAELFGDHTPLAAGGMARDGFQALAGQDDNGDGVVNQHDGNWHRLRVWRDLNQDGVSQEHELYALPQLDIASLTVTATSHRQTLRNGNLISDLGQYARTDGSIGSMADIHLRETPFFRQFRQHLDDDEGTGHLPDAPGSGRVRDLRAACIQSPALRAALIRYCAAASEPEQRALLPQLLATWAATAGMNSSLQQRAGTRYRVQWQSLGTQSLGDDAASTALLTGWEQTMQVLDAFNGQHFFAIRNGVAVASDGVTVNEGSAGQPGTIGIALSPRQHHALQQAYDSLQESVYAILLLQTQFKPLFDLTQAGFRQGTMQIDFGALQHHFEQLIAANRLAGLAELMEFFRYATTASGEPQWRADLMLARHLHQLDGSAEGEQLLAEQRHSSLFSNNQYNTIVPGTGGDDMTFGYARNDLLRGGAGDDHLFGDDGNDLLDGGSGDDQMNGGDGNDIYLLRRHAGHDLIDNRASWHHSDPLYTPKQRGHDIVMFDDVASGAAITLRNRGGDLLLEYGAQDSVAIRHGLTHRHHEVGTFHFSDDVMMTTAELVAAYGIEPVQLDDKHDFLQLSRYNDTLFAGAGDDTVDGARGNDALYGEHGDDLLTGGSGNDILDGGTGNNILIGGSGDDVIFADHGTDVIAFNRGDGNDRVHLASTGGSATLSLGGGIRYADLMFRKTGNDLLFNLGAFESLTLNDWYADSEPRQAGILQMILHGDHNPASRSALNTSHTAYFDFSALVAQFDAVRAAHPRLRSWSLSSALPHHHLGGADDTAIGGERVYLYGHNRDFLLPALSNSGAPASAAWLTP